MSQQEESFGWATILDVGTFQVDFSQTTKALIQKSGKNGSYTSTEYSIVVRSAEFINPLVISGVSQKNYDRMRVLRAKGLINLKVTRGVAPLGQPSQFAPYIISAVEEKSA